MSDIDVIAASGNSGPPSRLLNVAETLSAQEKQSPEHPAIITPDRVITYHQMKTAVGVIAAHLKQQGVKPGEVVGVTMAQNAAHVMTILAIAQIGAVSVPIHAAIPPNRRQLAARRFGASCIVSGRDDFRLQGLPFISIASLDFSGSFLAPEQSFHPTTEDSPFRIVPSSGTSGDPKGVMVTHDAIRLRVSRLAPKAETHPRFLPLDLNFIGGLGLMMQSLMTCGSLVLPKSMSVDAILHAITTYGVTHIWLSPAQVRELADCFAEEGCHCPTLLDLRVVGGPLSPQLLDLARRTLTPNVNAAYGSTESAWVAEASGELLGRHPHTVGRVCAWVEVDVVDDADRLLPAGSVGQLRIRSGDQATGYYLDEARTRKHFRDGWYYPGDLGRFDDEGLLYIEGRADDQLNVGGFKVNPDDIDATLAAHPAVIEAGTFVLTLAEGSELIAAAVVLRSGGQIADVRAHAIAQLGPIAPQRYFIASALPRTITGKLQRIELTAQFTKTEHGQVP